MFRSSLLIAAAFSLSACLESSPYQQCQQVVAATALRKRSPKARACSSENQGVATKNSSPPKRPTISSWVAQASDQSIPTKAQHIMADCDPAFVQ